MSLKVISGKLQQDMGWGRKEGQGYIGLFNERPIGGYYLAPRETIRKQMKALDFVAALTYREISTAIATGVAIGGFVIPLARGLLGF